MSEIIFLVHRLPFPPDKGDKIRSFHLLKHLCANYDVHLGCFIDDPNDERYVDDVAGLCASTKIGRINPGLARVRSLRGLLYGQALSVPYYFDKAMAGWVDTTLQDRDIASVVAYSSPMGQYVMGARYQDYRRIMDFVDVDSDKWRQYAEGKSWPMSWIYNREAKRLLDFERQVAREFDASVFVTSNEVDLFDKLAPETSRKHFAVANGVATDYFDPAIEFENPYPEYTLPIVFTGMMDYWANVDAVSWFAKEVLPEIRAHNSSAEFWIVGASPTKDVLALDSLEGVHVTGRVPDVRPYLKHAELAVAPLRIARGMQNKVLEALAMGCPVLCTSHAATGLQQSATMPVTVLDDAKAMAAAAIRALGDSETETAHRTARRYTLDNYGWGQNLAQFERIHTGSASA